MQITSAQTPINPYESNPLTYQARQSEKVSQNPGTTNTDKDLTVNISAAAQALQKQAADKKAETSHRNDNEQVSQQQVQKFQAQPVIAKAAPRIDITV